MKRSFLVAVAGITMVTSGSAAAQEPASEVLRLPSEVGSARLVGLGGALVGLGGDVNAAFANPAGLIAVPRSFDAAVSVGGATQTSFGLAIHPVRTMAAGLFVWSRSAEETLVPATVESSVPRPLLKQDFLSPAGGVAWSPDRRLAFGVGCRWVRFSLRDGGASRPKAWGSTCALGFFLQPDNPDAVRLGIVYRLATDVDFAAAPGGPGPARLREPDVVSAGVSWRYDLLRNTRLVMSAQPELVRYSQLSAPPAAGGGAARDLHDDLDVRFGVEASFPFGCVTGCGSMWQLRAAVVSRAPVPFEDPTAGNGSLAVQGPSRRTSWSVGAALAHEALFSGNLRFDFAYRHEDRTFVAGVAVRYPEAFRADLQHHRRRR